MQKMMKIVLLYIDASCSGLSKVVQELLNAGSDISHFVIDAKCDNGWTPLHWSAQNGHEDVVELLIDHKALIDEVDLNGNTPLYYASLHGYLEVVKLLVQHSDPTIKNKDGETALDIAGSEEIEKLIQDYLEVPLKEPVSV